MDNKRFEWLAGSFAVLAGLFGFVYSISFVILRSDRLSALFLLLSGLAALVVMTALYRALREADASVALLAFALSAGAAAGSLIHGGYDLSNSLHPPASLNMDLPNPVDPRGLLTFGVAGLGILLFSWMMARKAAFPAGLRYLGFASAVLMIALYIGRLVVLQATSPLILIPALLEGFIINPVWYVWLAITFLRPASR
jgi:hypothetical protein